MTIPVLIVVNLLVGASIAYSARIQIRTLQRPLFANRYFTALLMMELMILLPVGIYFSSFYPDWSWMYLIDTSTLPPGCSPSSVRIRPTLFCACGNTRCIDS